MRDTLELDAFTAECAAAEATLRAAPAGAASLPGLGEWDLGALVGHLVGVAGRLLRYEPVDAEATVDRVTYFVTAPHGGRCATATTMDSENATAALRSGRIRVSEPRPGRGFGDEALPVAQWGEAFAEAWRATAARCHKLEGGTVLDTPLGRIRAIEYLATRVLEVVVHHMDVRAALDLPPAGTIEAERITQAILEGALDGPRPRNLGRTRFILAATGRVGFDDPRFPVMR